MKARNIYERIFCVLLPVAITFMFFGYCYQPIVACADVGPYDVITTIDNFVEDVDDALDRVEHAVADSINSGSLDPLSQLYTDTSIAIALQIAAANNPVINDLKIMADSAKYSQEQLDRFASYLNSNPTITISSSGMSGDYTSAIDGKVHFVSLNQPPESGWDYTNSLSWTCATSDEFTVYFSASASGNGFRFSNSSNAGIGGYYYGGYNILFENNASYTRSGGSYFTGFSSSASELNVGGYSQYCRLVDSAISPPVVSRVASNMNEYGFILDVGRYQGAYTLPETTVPTDNPGAIYNIVNNYIRQNYPNVSNEYYFFPDGYTPGGGQDPTEPPIFPNTIPWQPDFVLPQTETSVSIVNPTATDESGSTYTETTIVTVPVTETSVSYDPVYGFNVPLLPNLETVTATLPQDTVPSTYSSSISNLWNMIKWVLDNSGLFPVFLAIVSVGFVLFILKFLGG